MSAYDERAQDLAEALHACIDAATSSSTNPGWIGDLADAVNQGRILLESLTYDTYSSASSQNYIDAGVRLLVEHEPPRLSVDLVMVPDPDEVDDPDVESPRLLPALRCPSCQAVNGWQEIDTSSRWNEVEVQVNDRGGLALDITQGDCEHETVGFRCNGCGAVADIPADSPVPVTYSWS